MYLEILLKAKFGVRAELWSIVKRWYPVLTQSFNVVCDDDGEFQRSDFTACSGQNVETTRWAAYDCVIPRPPLSSRTTLRSMCRQWRTVGWKDEKSHSPPLSR